MQPNNQQIDKEILAINKKLLDIETSLLNITELLNDVKIGRKKYQKDNEKTFANFINDPEVVVDEILNVKVSEVYYIYCACTRTTYTEEDIMSKNMFSRFMRTHGWVSKIKSIAGRSELIFVREEL